MEALFLKGAAVDEELVGSQGNLGYMSVVVGLAIPKTAPNVEGAQALIDYLTRFQQQIAAGSTIGFLPVVEGVKLTSSAVPLYLNAEAGVSPKYAAAKNAVVALLTAANASCWPPDLPSSGPCQIK